MGVRPVLRADLPRVPARPLSRPARRVVASGPARPPTRAVTGGAGELLAVGFEGTALPEAIVELSASSGLGGVVLFARNCPTLDAVLTLTAAARALGPDVLVLVDHEGGRVHRLPAAVHALSPRRERSAGRATPSWPRASPGRWPVSCAPRGSTPGSRRSWTAGPIRPASSSATGRTPRIPRRSPPAATAFVRAALAEGLIPVAKHFPGSRADARRLPPRPPGGRRRASPSSSGTELVPFRRALAAGCPAVMVAHVRYPALDPEWPASLSEPRHRGTAPRPPRLRRPRPERRPGDGRGQERLGRRASRPRGSSRWAAISPSSAGKTRHATEAVAAVGRALASGALTPGRRPGGARPPGGPPAVGRADAAAARPGRHRLRRASGARGRDPRSRRRRPGRRPVLIAA